MPAGFTAADFYYLLPELLLTGGALLVLVLDVLLPRREWATFGMTLLTLSVTGAAVIGFTGVDTTISAGLLAVDGFATFFKSIVIVSALVTVLMSPSYLRVEEVRPAEYYFLILCATLGMLFMASGVDLITLFIGLETMAVSFYILAGYLKPNQRSNEASVKYFLLGAFSLGILLYGMSLFYGATGTTSLSGMAEALASGERTLVVSLALVLLVAGMGFKIAAVPFHMWAPDVYEGAPTPVTAFMSVTAKIGGFAALLRLLVTGLSVLVLAEGGAAVWQSTATVIAILTLVLGNFVAISQRSLKRMLAYSSIAHAGYIMVAVAAAGTANVIDAATQGALIYMMAYMFTNLGAFAVVMAIEREDGSGGNIEDIAGLARSRPLMAMAMTIFMLSLTGIPLTAGFVGKFMVFASAIQAGLFSLAVIGVLTSVVSAFYYVRVVVNMYLRDGSAELQPALETQYVRWAINIALAGTMIFGIFYPLATNLVSMVSIA